MMGDADCDGGMSASGGDGASFKVHCALCPLISEVKVSYALIMAHAYSSTFDENKDCMEYAGSKSGVFLMCRAVTHLHTCKL